MEDVLFCEFGGFDGPKAEDPDEAWRGTGSWCEDQDHEDEQVRSGSEFLLEVLGG